jgi:flagellar hook assembly protein FlgD
LEHIDHLNFFHPIQTVTQSNLNVSVFDAKGRLVNTLINKNKAPGFYSLKWDGRNLNGRYVPTGVYFIQVKSGENIDTRKVALIK